MEKSPRERGNASKSFVEILEEMNQEGGFSRSVLATSEGLPVASAPYNPDNELASAMIALLGQVSSETQDQLGLMPVDEVTIRTEDRVHLVCRTISTGDDWLSLGAIVPPGHYYRRATNRAIKRIREVLGG